MTDGELAPEILAEIRYLLLLFEPPSREEEQWDMRGELIDRIVALLYELGSRARGPFGDPPGLG